MARSIWTISSIFQCNWIGTFFLWYIIRWCQKGCENEHLHDSIAAWPCQSDLHAPVTAFTCVQKRYTWFTLKCGSFRIAYRSLAWLFFIDRTTRSSRISFNSSMWSQLTGWGGFSSSNVSWALEQNMHCFQNYNIRNTNLFLFILNKTTKHSSSDSNTNIENWFEKHQFAASNFLTIA